MVERTYCRYVAVLFFLLILAVAASATGTNETEKQGLVVFGTVQPEVPESVFEEIARGFEQENPEVEVIWDLEGKWGDHVQRWTTAKLAGEQIDLQFTGANALRSFLHRKRFAMDITDATEDLLDRFYPSTISDYRIGDRLWALPLRQVSTSTWYYNRGLFRNSGMGEAPRTYEEMKEAAQKLKSAGVKPAIHEGKNTYMWPMWYFETFAQSSGNNSIEYTIENLQGQRKFTNQADVQALEAINRFFTDGILGQETLETDSEGMRAAFITGEVAMYYGGTWEIPFLKNAKAFDELDIGVFEFPQMAAGATPQHGGGCGRGIGIYAGIDPQHFESAVKFLEYMSRKDIATMYLAPMEPIFTSIKGGPKSDLAIAETLLDNHINNTITFLDWIWPAEIADGFKAGIQNVISGQMKPQEAMQAIQDIFDSIKSEGFRYDYWNTWTEEEWEEVRPPK